MIMEDQTLTDYFRDIAAGNRAGEPPEAYVPSAEAIALGFPPEDPAREYLARIGQLKLLTEAQEQTLAEQAAGGDDTAREQLLEHSYLRAAAIAREYLHRGMCSLDLIQEGNEALVKALRSYDPGSIYPFGAYANWKIRRAMSQALKNYTCMLRVPEEPVKRAAPPDQDLIRNPAMLRWLLERHNGASIAEEDWMILAARFWPWGHRSLNLEETAAMMGITREAVRRAEYRTIRGRRIRRAKKIRDFYTDSEPEKQEKEE